MYTIMSLMSFFTSKRERTLWLWVLLIVFTIYATLGLMPSLSEYLRDRGLLTVAFVTGMLLVGGVILTKGLKVRPKGVEISVALGLAAVYLLMFMRMANPEERTHLMEYGVVALLIHETMLERTGNGRRIPVPALLAVLMTAVLGWIDEGIQWILPNRIYDFEDVIFNFLAAVIAIGGSLVLGWVRSRCPKRRLK